MSPFEAVIGLEVHAQLLTRSKMFCGCSTAFGEQPNTQVCPVCAGLPGALPVLNGSAVDLALRMGLATNCRISRHSAFARKNYFYPDCPKNYQISQYEEPLCADGYLTVAGRRIEIERIHLEEDAGKLIHPADRNHTWIDLNRSGIPLLEIVSRPDIRAPEEASQFVRHLRSILRYLDICDGNMEEGSLRCDVNVSMRALDGDACGTKTEIKNLNSFKAIESALRFEMERQQAVYTRNGTVHAETLLWDKERGQAFPMRSKEQEHDYRYFPEPDLLQLEVTGDMIERAASAIPELPADKEERFVTRYGVPRSEAAVLAASRDLAAYFESVAEAAGDARAAANWVLGEVLRELNASKGMIADFTVPPRELAELIAMCKSGAVNLPTAKNVFKQMVVSAGRCRDIIEKKKLGQISDNTELQAVVTLVLDEHPGEVQKYLEGREQLFTFFMGRVMEKTSGRANPQRAASILKEELGKKH